ncbi:hypothetical protein NQZ68_018135, partial [Dissostichus eleginoides]
MKIYLLLGVIGATVILSRGQNDDDDDDYDDDDDDGEYSFFVNGENHNNMTGNLTGNLTFLPPYQDDDEPS